MADGHKSLTEMLGETAREAGVLIFVFGMLDGFLDDVARGALWYASVVGASAVALTMGYYLEMKR
jgi:hypothetical protein